MRLIAEDVTMQDLKGIVADAKAETARDAARSGLIIGGIMTLLLTGAMIALFFAAGVIKVTPPNAQNGGQHLVPPSVGTTPAPPLPSDQQK